MCTAVNVQNFQRALQDAAAVGSFAQPHIIANLEAAVHEVGSRRDVLAWKRTGCDRASSVHFTRGNIALALMPAEWTRRCYILHFHIERRASKLQGYKRVDTGLLAHCAEHRIDYSACTSVTALLTGELLTVAHLGDSKIVLGRDAGGGTLAASYLTQDHKPDMVEERRRIESCGGSLAYLHGGKPFIRGGDFSARCGLGASTHCLVHCRPTKTHRYAQQLTL